MKLKKPLNPSWDCKPFNPRTIRVLTTDLSSPTYTRFTEVVPPSLPKGWPTPEPYLNDQPPDPPPGFLDLPGATKPIWNCLWGHLQMVRECTAFPLLIFEEDAVPTDHFTILQPLNTLLVPEQTGFLYLGGTHFSPLTPLFFLGTTFYGSKSINRTHAYAVFEPGAPFFSTIEALVRFQKPWPGKTRPHVDHLLQALAHPNTLTLCPDKWYYAQGPNKSQINFRDHPYREWPNTKKQDPLDLLSTRDTTVVDRLGRIRGGTIQILLTDQPIYYPPSPVVSAPYTQVAYFLSAPRNAQFPYEIHTPTPLDPSDLEWPLHAYCSIHGKSVRVIATGPSATDTIKRGQWLSWCSSVHAFEELLDRSTLDRLRRIS